MKVSIIHNHPIHYKHQLFKALKTLGANFEVIFATGESNQRIERHSLQPEYRCSVAHDGPFEGHPAWAVFRRVWQKLNVQKPDVVIIGGYHFSACWSALVWGMLNRKPRILWIESNRFDYPRNSLRELPKRFFVSQCSKAHVYGNSNRDYMLSLGMKPESIIVKRAVVNVELFHAQEPVPELLSSPVLKLLYVGRLAEEKNLSFLLDSLAVLKRRPNSPAVELNIVGYGPLEAELRKQAQALGLGDSVHFLGAAKQAELSQVYAQAHAFVLPSTREPWGLVALEALLCGRPILISTRCGCADDLAVPGVGWTFSPFDEDAAANLIEQVARLPRAELFEMGRRGIAIAREYSAENCASIVLNSVREVHAQRTTPDAFIGTSEAAG